MPLFEVCPDEGKFDSHSKPTSKGHAYTLIYHTFFMMQITNLVICRITFWQEDVFQKSWESFKLFLSYFQRKPKEPFRREFELQIKRKEKARNALHLWLFLIFISSLQIFIVQKGQQYGLMLAPLSLKDYLQAQVVGFGLLLWHSLAKSLYVKIANRRSSGYTRQ